MNLGQTMITSGMFVLLVMSVISANRMLVENTELTLQAEAMELSSTIAEDLIAEASFKKFDVTVPDGDMGFMYPWDFGTCGPSPTERSLVPLPDTEPFKSLSTFNDFDDYDGYRRIVNAGGISGFVVNSYVYYVDEYNPDLPSYWQTYYKKMEVRVSHPQYIVDKEGKAFKADGSPVQIVYTSLMSY